MCDRPSNKTSPAVYIELTVLFCRALFIRELTAATKTSPETITMCHFVFRFIRVSYFAIISTRPTFTETVNYPRIKLVGVAFKLLEKENDKFTVVRSRSPQNLEVGVVVA